MLGIIDPGYYRNSLLHRYTDAIIIWGGLAFVLLALTLAILTLTRLNRGKLIMLISWGVLLTGLEFLVTLIVSQFLPPTVVPF